MTEISIQDLIDGGAKQLAKAKKKKKQEIKTAHNTSLFNLKRKITDNHFKTYEGSLVRSHRLGIIDVRECFECKEKQFVPRKVLIISKAKDGREEITGEIKSHGMFQFNSDIPLKISFNDVFSTICADCLIQVCNEQSNEQSNDQAVAKAG